MSTGPPKKPEGPPPRPVVSIDPNATIRGVGDSQKKPPGPPPGASAGPLKPPPLAPPPIALLQTSQRPAIESIKGIVIPKVPSKPSTANTPVPVSQILARGPPPPRGLTPELYDKEEHEKQLIEAQQKAAAPKFDQQAQPSTKKEGAISMFETPVEPPVEPAEKKARISKGQPLPDNVPKPGPPPRPTGAIPQSPSADPTSGAVMIRAPRPLPPQAQAPGIPEGQPLPPESKPPTGKPPPPSSKEPPNRNRAPPRGEPRVVPAPDPPKDSDPPYFRGKKAVVDPNQFLKRREKEHPEFEESSSDEELDSDGQPKRTFVRQPGRPKQQFIATGAAAEKEAEKKKEALIAQNEAIKAKELEDKIAAAEAAAAAEAMKAQEEELKKIKESAKVESAKVESAKIESTKAESAKIEVAVEKSVPVEEPPIVEEEALPSMPVKENVVSAYVPEPPEILEPYVDQSKLGKILSTGRLSIRCVGGTGIRRRDDNAKVPRTDPYIKFKLGVAERHPWKTTQVYRKQTDEPSFENELISFDILEPGQFIFNNDITLMIEVMNKGTFKDESMGSVSLSIVRFLSNAFIAYDEVIPLYFPGSKVSTSKLSVSVVFEEARPGIFEFTLYEARGLRNIDPMGQQVPYVNFALGKHYKKRSKSVKDNSLNPYFAEEQIMLWVDSTNWANDLLVSLLDEALGEDRPISYTNLNLLPYMNSRPDDARQDSFDLIYKMIIDPKDEKQNKLVSCGELDMKVRYLPAGVLKIKVHRAKGLFFPEHQTPPGGASRMDPYVSFSLEGRSIKMVKRTPADKDGGAEPTFESDIKFEIVDQYLLDVDVYNQGVTESDILLGSAQISLLSCFRGIIIVIHISSSSSISSSISSSSSSSSSSITKGGEMQFWTTLKQKKPSGGIVEAGDIFMTFEFNGPVGISFPQLRPEVDSFDDTYRKFTEKKREEEEVITKKVVDTIPDESEVWEPEPEDKFEIKPKAPKQEFSDEEIVAAFKFIDLDHNNYVGAKEIRHILVCMGEMITDEEIDTMISMVDSDGDGQVSFQEFRTLVLHPNPGMIDVHKEVTKAKEEDIAEDRNALAGKFKSTDLSAYQRQKEMTQREAKKKMLVTYVVDNEVTFEYIKAAFTEFEALPKEKRLGYRIKFDEFYKCLQIEPIQVYKNLFILFDNEENGDVDFREFLLSLFNFIQCDRELRMRFSFTMFDMEKLGFISIKQVEEILRGNHMTSLQSIKRKAETIMKQAATKNGTINQNEFVVVSKKFPNILIPNIGGLGKMN